jgi:hypothetical protein
MFRSRRLTTMLGALLVTAGTGMMAASPASAASQVRFSDVNAFATGFANQHCDVGGDTPAVNDRCVFAQVIAARSSSGTIGLINFFEFVFVGGVFDPAASRFTSGSGPVTLRLASVNSATFSGTIDITVTDLLGAAIPGSGGPQRLSVSLTGVGQTTRSFGHTTITGPNALSTEVFSSSLVSRNATGQATLDALNLTLNSGAIATSRQASVVVNHT